MQIFEKWNDVPEELHNKPRLDNGLSVIVFDNQTEFETYITTNKQWNKQTYCNELNESHTQLFKSIYLDKGYLSYSEVEGWAHTTRTDERSLQWKSEAQSIIDWYQSTCITLYDYMDNVTEETSINISDFIELLPNLNMG